MRNRRSSPHRRSQIATVTVCLAVAATCAAPLTLHAQEHVGTPAGGWSIGGSVGLPGYDELRDVRLAMVGVQMSQLRPNTPGADIALATMPRALLDGVFALAIRSGAVLPIAASDRVAILPSAGLSMIAGAGPGGAGAGAGGYAGLGVLLGGFGATAFRGGVTWHRYGGLESPIRVVEAGFSRMLPR